MKRHTKIAATTEPDGQLMFTPASVVDLLLQIDELKDKIQNLYPLTMQKKL